MIAEKIQSNQKPLGRSLSSLKIGQRAKVLSIHISDKKVKNHLLDMGLIIGTEVQLKRIAPMGDPMNLWLRGYELSVRRAELDMIYVEVL
ncbi:MAG: ferrous iron transport protein A [Clostridia bacterium]|nr:ferrous iron transport protein A [Clostridia bacterium]